MCDTNDAIYEFNVVAAEQVDCRNVAPNVFPSVVSTRVL